jgi:hypothetical protein
MQIDLLVHAPEIVWRIDAELPLIGRVVGDRMRVAFVVDVGPFADPDAAEVGNLAHHEPEHVIERAVLHHEHDDVLDRRMRTSVRSGCACRPEHRRRRGAASDH